MRKLLLAWCVSISFTCLLAQEKIIELNAANAPFKPDRVPFKDVVVLDNRIDTTKVGIAQIGAFNKQVPARFNAPAAIAIQQYILDLINSTNKGSEQLLINLRQLSTLEKTLSASERGFVDFAADAYIQKNDSEYVKVFSIDTTYLVKGMDVTKATCAKVPEAISYMVAQIAATDLLKTDFSKRISFAEIRSGINKDWAQLPVNSAPFYVKGVYKTFEDFRNNNIDTVGYAVVNITDTTFKVFTHNEDGSFDTRRVVKKIWGINDGHQSYILFENDFVPLVRKNNTFFFTANVTNTQAAITGAAAGGASFGLVGGLIGNSSKLYCR